jgi:hypothetical protein
MEKLHVIIIFLVIYGYLIKTKIVNINVSTFVFVALSLLLSLNTFTTEQFGTVGTTPSPYKKNVNTFNDVNIKGTLNIGNWHLKTEGPDKIFVIRNTESKNDSRFAIYPDGYVDVSNKSIKTNTINTFDNSMLNVSNITSSGMITGEYITTLN